MDEIDIFLKTREKEDLLRRLNPAIKRFQGKIIFKDRELIDFSSNDYLGLSAHPALMDAATKALKFFGASSSASRLMSGDFELHHELEEKTAALKGKEAALIFNSGYQANLGIISSLFSEDDCIFCDRLSHASIIDGILLSGARFFRFRHNDVEHLESLLKANRKNFKKALIITETIFSMDGDRAPLKEIVRLKEKFDCIFMVDEAHATGIFGENGSGIAEEEGLTGKIELIMGTFSKALGSFGAYVASSRKITDFLINTSRSFIYSTALPPSISAANIASIDLIKKEPYRRKELLSSSEYLRNSLIKKGFSVKGSSQIIPVMLLSNKRALDFSKALKEKGYLVMAIRPPTVPKGEARLRLSLNVEHKKEILDRFLDDISKI